MIHGKADGNSENGSYWRKQGSKIDFKLNESNVANATLRCYLEDKLSGYRYKNTLLKRLDHAKASLKMESEVLNMYIGKPVGKRVSGYLI